MKASPAGIAIAVSLLGCSEMPPDRSEVQRALLATAALPIGHQVALDTVAAFPWDSAWVFEPYAVPPSGRLDHPAQRAAQQTSVAGQDHSNVIVFTAGTDVTGVVEVPRRNVDLRLGARRGQALTRATARFLVCEAPIHGTKWLVVAPPGPDQSSMCRPGNR